MCDALMMYENGISADRCACYAMSEREVKFFLVLDLKVCYVGKDGGKYTFCVYNHTSKQFTWMSMQDFRIPIGVIPDKLTSNYAIFLLLQALVNAFIELGNGDGG